MTEDQDASPPRKSSGGLARFVAFLLLLLVCTGMLAGYDAWRFLTSPAQIDNPQESIIDIKPGMTFIQIADELARLGAVSDARRFLLLARFKGKVGSIQAGEFQISTGWTPLQLLDHLTTGRPLLYRLSLREGLPWWEVARLVESGGFASAAEFKAVIHDPEFLRAYGIPFANAEGFLFPETYLLRKPKTLGGREQAEAVARLLVESFWRHTWPLWQEYAASKEEKAGDFITLPALRLRGGKLIKAPAAGGPPERSPAPSRQPGEVRMVLSAGSPQDSGTKETPAAGSLQPAVVPVSRDTLQRLVTLASLVEKETGVPEERARVAGVYANRLRLGMLLQCDPTIIYGLGEAFKGPIRRSQLEDPGNLYNTYRHPGLPPGPIASPGLAALRAALHPEDHDYLYFVAVGDGGKHEFSATLRGHQKAVERYRAWQRQNPRKK